MSYSFTLGFVELEPAEVLAFCVKIADDYFEQASEVIGLNDYYIPSPHYSNADSQAVGRLSSALDRQWLYQLFNISFVFWENKNLLAILGHIQPGAVKNKFSLWQTFQNSVDQDYDFQSWIGIKCFENEVSLGKQATAQDLKKNPDYSDYTIAEIDENLDYYQKCQIYENIYCQLNLEAWMCDKKGNFQRFCINAIDSQEKYYDLVRKLQIVKNGLSE